ncbi:hypothetical protein BKA66DRAFT_424670, partial [Pyrenochaeta sp. MPI-SDFR-AT-0127]
MVTVILFIFLASVKIFALNFDWERNQLSEFETIDNSVIRFGSSTPSTAPKNDCKVVPGDLGWPSEEDWASFNETLGGALLKPKPLGSVCYAGEGYSAAQCQTLKSNWAGMNLQYVKTIRQVAMGIRKHLCTYFAAKFDVYTRRLSSLRLNFARNNNIRLVIKNSGHDFNGKSIGGHSLSVWTHNLKGIAYLANYTSPTGSYTGQAVAYAAGVQAFEGSLLMRRHNITFIVAGGSTVGIAGGFLQGGGHSVYTSYYGLAADQVLAITAVTADGMVVEAHEGQNADLFWAFRGGGGGITGTYGIITSVVIKAFPDTPRVSGSIRFSTTPTRGSNASAISVDTFWAGMKAYWEFGPAICDAGGLGYNYIYPNSTSTGLTFTVSISLPNRSLEEYRRFIRPLLEKLNGLGIDIPIPSLKRSL